MTSVAAPRFDPTTPRHHRDRSSSVETGEAVVLAFPELVESQAALLASARALIQDAWELTRSEAVARALVEADRLLEHLVVD